MATVNIANNTWQTQRETSTINITANSTYVEFNMGYDLTDEMANAKACVAIDASKYETITFTYSGKYGEGISDLEFGIYDNMTPSDSSGNIGIAQDAWNGSGSVTVDISNLTGTRYVGFRFSGNTYVLNDNVGWGVYQKLNITSLTAVEMGYTLTYNANGGSGAPGSVSNITSTTISSTIPTRSGYDFLGWSKSSSATSTSYVAGDSISLNSNTTLYAVWIKFYTVTYNANGGSNAPSSQKKTHGTTLTLTTSKPTPPSSTTSNSNYTFNITGNANGGYFGTTATTTTNITATERRTDTIKYTFSNWNTNSGGTGTSYNAGASYTSNADATLYAQYSSSTTAGTTTYSNNAISGLSTPNRANSKQATYTVSFDANGGTCSTTELTADKVRSYTFKGWGSSAGTTSVLANTTTYTSDATVYAVWDYTDSTAAITLPRPTRNGYAFMGWATDAFATSGTTGSYKPTGNITLYAVWKCSEYGYVYIYDNNGELNPYQVFIYDGSGWNQYAPYIY